MNSIKPLFLLCLLNDPFPYKSYECRRWWMCWFKGERKTKWRYKRVEKQECWKWWEWLGLVDVIAPSHDHLWLSSTVLHSYTKTCLTPIPLHHIQSIGTLRGTNKRDWHDENSGGVLGDGPGVVCGREHDWSSWLFRPTIRRQFWARGEEQDGFGEGKGLKTNPSLLLQVPWTGTGMVGCVRR